MTTLEHPVRFDDHFAPVAAAYADYRPRYPRALVAWVAGLAPARHLAWDCATGSGQVALDLVDHFERVVATDASAAQLATASAHPKILYRLARAEDSGLPDRSVDLITVAQALHWLDPGRFYAEVRRVLRPEGVLAVWSYGRLAVDDAGIGDCLDIHYHEIVAPYWPSERRHVDAAYRSLEFPFPEISAPAFELKVSWTMEQLLGYLGSSSAAARYRADRGSDPIARLRDQLAPYWPEARDRRTIAWPLTLRVGRIPSAGS